MTYKTEQNHKNKEPLYIIYMITNTKSGKRYIGKTIHGLNYRWSRHLSDARAGMDKYFHRAIRKYGEDCWITEVLYMVFEADDNHLYAAEALLIADWNTFKDGYNSCVGGVGSGSGKNHPQYGIPLTPNHRAAISKKLKGNTHLLGHTHTESTRALLSSKLKGVKKTPEHRLAAMVGKRAAGVRKNNKSGIPGVKYVKKNNKWRSLIYINSKDQHLGYFKNKNDAIIARLMAELEHWGQILIY